MPRQLLPPDVYRLVRPRSRGYIPHWEVDGGTYSVTFRELDSLPRHVRLRLDAERLAIRKSISGDRMPTVIENTQIRRLCELSLDGELDRAYGRCRIGQLAQVVASALTHFDRDRYELFAWSVMPNHVHVVFTAHEPLQKTLHSWKSFIAHQADGPLFEREYFDRLIRDERDLEASIAYVRNNPSKAGMHNWPWIG